MAGVSWTTHRSSLALPRLSAQVRYAALPLMVFRQFVRPEPGFGAGAGDEVRIARVHTTGDEITPAPLGEFEDFPMDSVQISYKTITIQEWGRGIPWTFKAEYLSQLNIYDIIIRKLTERMALYWDHIVANVFKQTPIKAVPTSSTQLVITTNGTPGGTAAANLNTEHLRQIYDYMRGTLRVPYYDQQGYMALVSIKASRGIKSDSNYIQAALYGDPDRLFNSELGRWEGFRFVETNRSSLLSNSLGTGGVLGEAIFFGDDPVVEVIAYPEEIMVEYTNLNRGRRAVFYMMGNWDLTWETAAAGEARVIHVTSA